MIFISYSLKDEAPFTSLCLALESANLPYWKGQLKAGASLKEQLREAISKCDVCIFIATRSSVISPWCMNEIGAFWGAGKRIVLYSANPDIGKKLPDLFKGDYWTCDAREVIRQVREELAELKKLQPPPARDNDIKAHEDAERRIGFLQRDNDSLQMSINGKIDDLKAVEWLREVAERDKNSINDYVYIIFRKVKYEGLDEIEPYIEISFDIINASVYDITIDKNINDGAVYFNNTELNPKQAKLGGNLHRISRNDNEQWVLVIKQWISPELAKRIKNPLPDDKLYFDTLSLTVRGANEDQKIRAERLHLPRSIPIERPETLKAEIASLRTELESHRKSELTIELSTEFDSSVTFIHHKDRHPFMIDEYIIKAYLKIRFKNASEHNTTIESMTLSLCTRRDSGEVEEITPNRRILSVYPDSPTGAKSSGLDRLDFDAGFPVAGGSITPYFWFWYDLEISRKTVDSIGSNHILRLMVKDLRQKHPTIIDIKVDWESARNQQSYILPPKFDSTCILLTE